MPTKKVNFQKKEFRERKAELDGKAQRLRLKPAKNEISQDMGDSLLRFSAMAENYEIMGTIEDTLTAMLKILEERTYQPAGSTTLVANVRGKLKPVGVKARSSESNIVRRAKKWMKMVYYDNDRTTQKWWNKITDGLIRYSSLSYVAFNVFGNINNYTIARIK